MNDKVLHTLVGYLITSTLILSGIPWFVPLIIVVILAFAKEYYDKRNGGLSDRIDALATISGCLIYLGIYLITL